MNIINMHDFVLEQLKTKQSCSEFKEIIKNYSCLLKKPLTLEMFVPIGTDGFPVFEPVNRDFFKISANDYDEAKERVLFIGWTVKCWSDTNKIYVRHVNGRTIDLDTGLAVESQTGLNEKFQLSLTKSAIKRLGL
jgi:hypothetical protein